MNRKNVLFVEKIFQELSNSGVKYVIIDERWKKRGDIDIIVAKDSIKTFERVFVSHGFSQKAKKWPPLIRMYRGFFNNEIIFIGAHIGGYYGGFGGGIGTLGQMFSPQRVPKNDLYLSREAQAFILLYKRAARAEIHKYEDYFNSLIKNKKGRFDYRKFRAFCELAFSNADEIVRSLKRGVSFADVRVRFKTNLAFFQKLKAIQSGALRFLYKIFFPSPYIAFVGANGVGKSTVSSRLGAKLEKEKLKVACIYGGRFRLQVLAPLNSLLDNLRPDVIERGKNHDKGTKRVHMREVRIYHSRIIRIISPVVFFIDYALRYWLYIYPKRVAHDVVLVDRSFIDIFTSPNMNNSLCKLFFKLLIPKPKHILLYNDVDILLKRRPEFQRKHLEQQLRTYAMFGDLYLLKLKTDNYRIVDEAAREIEKLL